MEDDPSVWAPAIDVKDGDGSLQTAAWLIWRMNQQKNIELYTASVITPKGRDRGKPKSLGVGGTAGPHCHQWTHRQDNIN